MTEYQITVVRNGLPFPEAAPGELVVSDDTVLNRYSIHTTAPAWLAAYKELCRSAQPA